MIWSCSQAGVYKSISKLMILLIKTQLQSALKQKIDTIIYCHQIIYQIQKIKIILFRLTKKKSK